MHRTSISLAGVKVLGCTLWSHVPRTAAQKVTQGINDYALILSDDRAGGPLTTRESSRWHASDVQWLKHELQVAAAEQQTCLVLTHHAPSMHGTSNPKHSAENPLRFAFATELEHLMGYPVHTWVYGHTHYNNDQIINGTRVVSNQRGYDFRVSSGYNAKFVVQVPSMMPASPNPS